MLEGLEHINSGALINKVGAWGGVVVKALGY